VNLREDEPASRRQDFDALLDLPSHVVRRSMGKHGLGLHPTAPKHDSSAKTFLQLYGIHAGCRGLNGVQDIDPGFAARVKPGDFIVAGENFGCGSAMEIATLVVKSAGISVVLARSFSRTFYRNGINGGILLIECDTSRIKEGDTLGVEMDSAGITVTNHSTGERKVVPALPEAMRCIVCSGGLVEYMRQHGDFKI